jgi:protein SCO1/2
MMATPDGKMSRYFYGIDYEPRQLKLGIMDSSTEKIGNPAEKLLLYCYHYDPASGKYGLAILRVIRVFGVVTVLGLVGMMLVFWRRNKNKLRTENGELGFENE